MKNLEQEQEKLRFRNGLKIKPCLYRTDQQGRAAILCALLDRSGNRCEICGRQFDGSQIVPQVDHCHETEFVRGVLCRSCNYLLGVAHDNVTVLRKAVLYLMRMRTDQLEELIFNAEASFSS
jgi:hypothetical protein